MIRCKDNSSLKIDRHEYIEYQKNEQVKRVRSSKSLNGSLELIDIQKPEPIKYKLDIKKNKDIFRKWMQD